MIRRLAATALLSTACWSLVVCACSARASASVAASPTKSQALAFAHAVNLTAADMPGFKATASHETSAEKHSEGELSRCAGAPNTRDQIAEASSKEFGRESSSEVLNVQSGVSVERTSTLAAQELASVRSARGRACIARFVSRLFKRQKWGSSVRSVSVTPGSASAPGTTGSFAWRIRTTITVHGTRIPFSMDFLGFAYGPAEVTLFAFGLPNPLPAATEQTLFTRLVQRAKAHHV